NYRLLFSPKNLLRCNLLRLSALGCIKRNRIMFKRLRQYFDRRNTKILSGQRCRMRFEFLEDRRVLAVMADIVFLVDESGSDQDTQTQNWLATVVDDLATTLDNADIDARYGLVGFGESIDTVTHR